MSQKIKGQSKSQTKNSLKSNPESNGEKKHIKNGNENDELYSKIQSHFDERNKVEHLEVPLNANVLHIFYIESLIDKQIFMSGLLGKINSFEGQGSSSSKEGFEGNDTNSWHPSDTSTDQAMTKMSDEENSDTNPNQNLLLKLKQEIISVTSAEIVEEENSIVSKILAGNAAIVFGESALCCPLFGAEKRSIEEPPNSRVVKGPREGLVEDIFTNIGLIRKRLKTASLKQEDFFVGKRTKTQVSIFYLEDVVKPEILKAVKEKLKNIDIDGIIDSYYIESFLEKKELKFFRKVGNTEKPDILSAKILEGRIGILVDGSPVALTVPFLLFEDIQSAEDYYVFPTMASFVRIMRIVGLIFATLVPAVYVALQSYNYQILPINFLITLLSSIEGLSIPPLMEILVVLFLFEVITEASIRMPNSLGMALSIIGALALGNTAVDAGIISPPSIVTVAVSSVALYIIPDQISQTRILRVLFTVIGGIIGLYGVVVSFIILTTYLCSLDSFGVPYMAPMAPSIKSDKKDAFVKSSLEDMQTRPKLISGNDKVRQKFNDNFTNGDGSNQNKSGGE